MAPSCTVAEIQRCIGRKLPNLPPPVKFIGEVLPKMTDMFNWPVRISIFFRKHFFLFFFHLTIKSRAVCLRLLHISAGVSEPPHHDTQQHAVTVIVISSTTASFFQTNVFHQTFLQHCSAICLEFSANICSEL